MRKLILAVVLVVGCGDAGDPATRVDGTGGAGGEAVASGSGGGSPAGHGGATGGAPAGGQAGFAGAPPATGGSVGTGGATATGGSGTGGTASPSCLIPLSQVSGPATVSLAAGYVTGGGTASDQTRCSQQAVSDSSLMKQVIDGVPTGTSGWAESSYMIAPSGSDCQATITYARAVPGYTPACNELVTLKVIVHP